MTIKKWHGGKGSVYRVVDTDAYSKNWDRIFNNGVDLEEHPNCGTPDCCGKCDTDQNPEENS